MLCCFCVSSLSLSALRHSLTTATHAHTPPKKKVSAELPLQFSTRYRAVAFVSGIHVDEAAGAGGRVLISYGSADWDARVLEMSLGEVEALFARGPTAAAGAPGG